MHRAYFLALLALGEVWIMLASGTETVGKDAQPEDAKLAAFFQAYLEEECRQRPYYATLLGDHRYDDRLDDLSPAARAAHRQRLQQTLANLPKQISYAQLSRSAQIDYEILEHHFKKQLWLDEQFRVYEEDPRLWMEYLSDSVFLVLAQSTLPKEQNVRNVAKRIGFIPRMVQVAKESLKHPPRVHTEVAIKQVKGAIAFYEKGIYELTGENPQLSELREPCQVARRALNDYLQFLEKELLPRSTGNWRIGKERFARKLEWELDAGLTADEVVREAEAEADRVERDMYVIARQLWCKTFPDLPLPPDDGPGRRATIRAVLEVLSRDHGQAQELLNDTKATVERIRRFIRDKKILPLPEPDRCQIIEMPEFQRGFSVAYLNPAPPLDPKASSYYAVSPPPSEWDDRRVNSFLQEYNRAMLQILTIHEAYPGHYVQLEYTNRHPSLIRKVLYSGVFAEGWAVYTEQMMLDQGYGDGDLSLRLHQLKWYLRAVMNAILDHKMHCTAFSDEEALRLLVDRAYQTEGEAIGKIQRAKLSSCQLSTYFVGRTAFYRLRQKVSRQQGEAFQLSRFHEAVLSHGTLPVKYLPELLGVK